MGTTGSLQLDGTETHGDVKKPLHSWIRDRLNLPAHDEVHAPLVAHELERIAGVVYNSVYEHVSNEYTARLTVWLPLGGHLGTVEFKLLGYPANKSISISSMSAMPRTIRKCCTAFSSCCCCCVPVNVISTPKR